MSPLRKIVHPIRMVSPLSLTKRFDIVGPLWVVRIRPITWHQATGRKSWSRGRMDREARGGDPECASAVGRTGLRQGRG